MKLRAHERVHAMEMIVEGVAALADGDNPRNIEEKLKGMLHEGRTSMARKKKHEEHANHERWLVSYADFITLLFAFFTTLYAISTVDRQKVQKLAESVGAALHHVGQPKTMIDPLLPNPYTPSAASPTTRRGGARGPTGHGGAGAGHGQAGQVLRRRRALLRARRAPRRGAEPHRGRHLRARRHAPAPGGAAGAGWHRAPAPAEPAPLLVEGHTDDRKGILPSVNWRLSTERAITVLSYFVEEHGYPPGRMAASGYGQYHPVSPNDTEAGRGQNRRVDLVILRDGNAPPDYRQ